MVKILSARDAEMPLASRVYLALHELGYKRGGAISRTPWASTSTLCVHLRSREKREREREKKQASVRQTDYKRSYVLARTIIFALPSRLFYSTAKPSRAPLRIANKANVKETSVFSLSRRENFVFADGVSRGIVSIRDTYKLVLAIKRLY